MAVGPHSVMAEALSCLGLEGVRGGHRRPPDRHDSPPAVRLAGPHQLEVVLLLRGQLLRGGRGRLPMVVQLGVLH